MGRNLEEPEDFPELKALPDEALEALFREEVTNSNLSDPELLRAVFREEQARGLCQEAGEEHAWGIFIARLQDIDEEITAQDESTLLSESPKSADSGRKVSVNSSAASRLSPTGRYQFLRRMAVIAAVLALLLAFGGFSAAAVGYNIWEHFYSWTENAFSRHSPDTTAASAAVAEDLELLRETLQENGAGTTCLPVWFPDRNVPGTLRKLTFAENNWCISLQYTTDDRYLLFSCTCLTDNFRINFTKDAEEPLLLMQDNIPCYIFIDAGYYRLVYEYGSVFYSISGIIDQDEAQLIAASIHQTGK